MRYLSLSVYIYVLKMSTVNILVEQNTSFKLLPLCLWLIFPSLRWMEPQEVAVKIERQDTVKIATFFWTTNFKNIRTVISILWSCLQWVNQWFIFSRTLQSNQKAKEENSSLLSSCGYIQSSLPWLYTLVIVQVIFLIPELLDMT